MRQNMSFKGATIDKSMVTQLVAEDIEMPTMAGRKEGLKMRLYGHRISHFSDRKVHKLPIENLIFLRFETKKTKSNCYLSK